MQAIAQAPNKPHQLLRYQDTWITFKEYLNNNYLLYGVYAMVGILTAWAIIMDGGLFPVIFMAMVLSACLLASEISRHQDNEGRIRTYHHSAGRHDARPSVWKLHKGANYLEAYVCFDESCSYRPIDKEQDWNKLIGIGWGLLPWYDQEAKKWRPAHHKHSQRFVWRPLGIDRIELGAYEYHQGKRAVVSIGVIFTGRWHYLKMEATEAMTTFSIMDKLYNKVAYLPMPPADTRTRGYILSPWFGGNSPATKNMQIRMGYVAERSQSNA